MSFTSEDQKSLGSEAPGDLRTSLHRFLARERRQFPLLGWALVVGVLAGGAGGIFRLSVAKLFAWRQWWVDSVAGDEIWSWLLPVLFTGVALWLALFLVRRFAPETSGSGVQEIEGALDGVRPLRWWRVLPVKFFAGLFSLGGGLVLGREGPTIQMGGALGAMVSRVFRRSALDCHCLMAAGAGAGLAAAFNAPLAGILFVMEEMRPQFKYSFLSFESVMVACAAADIVVRLLTSQAPIFSIPVYNAPPIHTLWIFLILGVAFGALGVFFNRALVGTLDFFSGLKGWAWKSLGLWLGGAMGLLGWFYPGSIGGGYEVIPEVLRHHDVLTTLILLFVVRYATTVVSYGSGAPGGIFAPMLALGTLFGLWFGGVFAEWFPKFALEPGVFAIAGMGALFAATVRAPLTGILLAVEMTGNYSQILPLILTCMSATLVAQGLGGKPVYSTLLRRTLRLARAAK